MKPKSQERGQALILIALAAVGLFAFSALAIDGSRVFSDRRHAQNAADTAVLAAALSKIKGGDPTAYSNAATLRAQSNGFDTTNSTVEVHTCQEVLDQSLQPPCEGLPAGADASEYIQVVIRTTTKTTFARIIGRTEVPTVVSAIARASGSTGSANSSNDAAMFATKKSDSQPCFKMNAGGGLGNGGLVLSTHGSSISVNCNQQFAVDLGGSATLNMGTHGQVVGCPVGVAPQFHADQPFDCGINGGVSQNIGASTYAGVPTMPGVPTCTATISNPTIVSPITLTPGVYCAPSGLIVTGSGSLSGPSGKVQIVLQDTDMIVQKAMNFADLEIYSNNASVRLGSQAVVTANRLRFFSGGNGDFTIDGGAQLTSGDAYFYLKGGNIDWNGGAALTLHGPPSGDPYGGLLIYKPWGNTSEIILNGGTSVHLTGTFMVPNSPVTLNGGNGFELHSQLIASTFQVGGNATVDIYYLPSENFAPPNSPMIQLTK